ncbi:hypothetical protein TIFTF001_054292, partial [Ficus carica]
MGGYLEKSKEGEKTREAEGGFHSDMKRNEKAIVF